MTSLFVFVAQSRIGMALRNYIKESLWRVNPKPELNPNLPDITAVYFSVIQSPVGSKGGGKSVPHTPIQRSRLREALAFTHVASMFALTHQASR